MEKHQTNFKETIDKVAKRINIPLLLVLCLALILLLTFVSRYAHSSSLKAKPASFCSYSSSITAQGLVIRGEHLLTAPTSGYFVPDYEEGSKVAAGSSVGHMAEKKDDAEGTPVYSGPYSGMVCYSMDGWEELLNAEALQTSDRLALIQLYADGSVAANAKADLSSTAAGRTVAKIVDNLEGFHLLVWLDTPPHPFVKDGRVQLSFLDESEAEQQVTAEVEENGMLTDGRYYLLLNISSTAEYMLDIRHLDCQLLGEELSGIYLPESALVTSSSGLSGIWVVANGQLVFRPINITGHYEDGFFTDDIEEGVLVVTDPTNAHSGMKYYH